MQQLVDFMEGSAGEGALLLLGREVSPLAAHILPAGGLAQGVVTRGCFMFVPAQDFTEEWTDEKLYKKYELTEDEIAFIESTIRVME